MNAGIVGGCPTGYIILSDFIEIGIGDPNIRITGTSIVQTDAPNNSGFQITEDGIIGHHGNNNWQLGPTQIAFQNAAAPSQGQWNGGQIQGQDSNGQWQAQGGGFQSQNGSVLWQITSSGIQMQTATKSYQLQYTEFQAQDTTNGTQIQLTPSSLQVQPNDFTITLSSTKVLHIAASGGLDLDTGGTPFIPVYYSQAGDPTLATGEMAWWQNTSNGNYYIGTYDGSNLRKVQIS
jgi:hypothetical protein